jgi:hypothetical protein
VDHSQPGSASYVRIAGVRALAASGRSYFARVSSMTTVLCIERPRLILKRAVLRRTHPPSVCFCLANVGHAVAGVVDCLVELKRGLVGQQHSLPRHGWGYPTKADLVIGVILVESAELWSVVEQQPTDRSLETPARAYDYRSYWSLMFAGVVTYRSATQSIFQTAFHRRLDRETNEFSFVDEGDADLEYVGKCVS